MSRVTPMAERAADRLRRLLLTLRGPRPGEQRDAYLTLLERAVSHTLYQPTDTHEAPEWSREAFAKALAGHDVVPLTPEQVRHEGRDWPVYAQTMVGAKRLRNVRSCAERAVLEGIAGDLIEAGCWRGGVGVLMRGVLRAYGDAERAVYLADTFAGLPPPDEETYPADSGDLNHTAEELVAPRAEVEETFRRYGFLDERTRFLEGLFKDVLPTVRDRRWAVVRLDGDLYESTMDGLVNLYPQLSPGGFLIVDDYAFDNCRAAVDDYRREHGIEEPIERIDWTGVYWRRQR